jgi:hypothetical protein
MATARLQLRISPLLCIAVAKDLGDILLQVINTLEVKTNFPVVKKTYELDKRLSTLNNHKRLAVGLPETIQ